MEGKRNLAGATILIVLWLVLAIWAWLRPSDALSEGERRPLQQAPELSAQSLMDGSFVKTFELYTQDQFPLRDSFRRLKAGFHYGVLRQRDNNGIYLYEGHAAQLEYPLNQGSLQHALQVFEGIYRKYLHDSKIYLAIIPDKSYYLAPEGGYPAMDYDKLMEKIQNGMPYASYVNLKVKLTQDDYYKTDTHWRQERLFPVANLLCTAMGVQAPNPWGYTPRAVARPFYGVYYGQAALPVEAEVLYMLESPLLQACRVYNHETGSYGKVYDTEKLAGKDMYEGFLSGPVSLLTIENPLANTDRELILFRDSFGSSLAPLLVQGYKTVTLVDVRYVPSTMLDRFLDFHGQDVLFLYSTLVLNNSFQMK